MAIIPEALATAIQHHQSGRLQSAEQIYRRILAIEPDHADAIHLLGVICTRSACTRLDRPLPMSNNTPGRTSPDTTPIRCHAYHKIPTCWAVYHPPRASFCLRGRTRHSHAATSLQPRPENDGTLDNARHGNETHILSMSQGGQWFHPQLPSPREFTTMVCTYRTILGLLVVSFSLIGGTDLTAAAEPGSKADAWPVLEWKKATPSPFARVESPTAAVNGQIYLFGGFTDDLDASNEVDVYDPRTDTWTRKKDMPSRLTHLDPASTGTRFGSRAALRANILGPSPRKSGNTTLPPTPGPPGRRCPSRGRAAVWRWSDAICITSAATKRIATRMPAITGACHSTAEKLAARSGFARAAGPVSTAVLDGKLYALGGCHGHDVTQIDLRFCHRFDPATKQWSEIAGLPDGRSHFEGSTIVEGADLGFRRALQ